MTIRIGVLGCANIAFRSVVPAMLASGQFKLVAAASRTQDKADRMAATFSCEAMRGYQSLIDRDDVSALYIPLPTGLHEEWVLGALEAGKHVLVEKSLAMDFASARRMLDTARTNRLVLMEDFMYRYHSQHAFVRQHLQNGTIGDLRLVRARFGFPPLDRGNFRYRRELGGGVVLDAAAYTVNLALWILGNDLEVASADIAMCKDRDVSLYGSATLRSPDSGLTAQLGFGFWNFYTSEYELWGSEGSLLCDRAFAKPPTLSPHVRIARQGETMEYTLGPDDHFVHICEEFAACIRDEAFEKHWQEAHDQSRVLSELENAARKTYV